MQKKLIAYVITTLVVAFTIIGCVDTYAENNKEFILTKVLTKEDFGDKKEIYVLKDRKNNKEYIVINDIRYKDSSLVITPRIKGEK